MRDGSGDGTLKSRSGLGLGIGRWHLEITVLQLRVDDYGGHDGGWRRAVFFGAISIGEEAIGRHDGGGQRQTWHAARRGGLRNRPRELSWAIARVRSAAEWLGIDDKVSM